MSRLYLPSMTMYKTALMGWTDTVYSRWCALLDLPGWYDHAGLADDLWNFYTLFAFPVILPTKVPSDI
jgi:hypothetical protein